MKMFLGVSMPPLISQHISILSSYRIFASLFNPKPKKLFCLLQSAFRPFSFSSLWVKPSLTPTTAQTFFRCIPTSEYSNTLTLTPILRPFYSLYLSLSLPEEVSPETFGLQY
ncbi:hypothetical protein CIPAW_01G015200 [Carya illinoinensis]|uniref:Uncharacterized protein n=1 Tax=Carya illinoinensis TaxID=32201 RepID=A0A8T1RGS3_CARIL|nr:hypothetical protein CIPAW_01G015200 [Carya illinoinensis]